MSLWICILYLHLTTETEDHIQDGFYYAVHQSESKRSQWWPEVTKSCLFNITVKFKLSSEVWNLTQRRAVSLLPSVLKSSGFCIQNVKEGWASMAQWVSDKHSLLTLIIQGWAYRPVMYCMESACNKDMAVRLIRNFNMSVGETMGCFYVLALS